MKTISTLMSSLMISATLMANGTRPDGMLTIQSLTPGEIRVIVDGKRFEPEKNILMIDNVEPGYHNISVYKKDGDDFFRSFKRRFEMVYNSSVAVSPATSVVIAIDRYGRADISEKAMDDDFDLEQHDWDRDGDGRFHEQVGADDHDRGHQDHGRWEDNKSYNGYAQPMSDREFDQVIYSMQKEWFENNKIKSASFIISNNFFTAEQVKEMMGLFSFENNKLEIAKEAYSKTLDKDNYGCVAGSLTYKSSKQELARFIRSCE